VQYQGQPLFEFFYVAMLTMLVVFTAVGLGVPEIFANISMTATLAFVS